jgi:hypothetical protein
MEMEDELLNKENIRAADDLGGEIVEVPEWGGKVRIGVLSVAAANAIFDKEVSGVNPMVRLVGACLVDKHGARLFTEKELGELLCKNATVIQRLWKKACEVNGLNVKIEDAVKNSASDPGEDSSSA